MDSNMRSIFLHLLNVIDLETSREKIPYNAAWLSAVLQPALTNSWCAVSTAVNPLWVTSGLAVPTWACIFSDMIHDVLDPVTMLAQWLWNSGNNLVCYNPRPRPWRNLYLDEARNFYCTLSLYRGSSADSLWAVCWADICNRTLADGLAGDITCDILFLVSFIFFPLSYQNLNFLSGKLMFFW